MQKHTICRQTRNMEREDGTVEYGSDGERWKNMDDEKDRHINAVNIVSES